MPSSAGFHLVISLAALVPLLAGVWHLRRSRRRRRGTTPHCAGCEYNLTANTSAICPECGLELTPANVRTGARAPDRGQFAFGVALATLGLLVGGGFGTQFVRTFDWYRIRPAGGLIDDAASRDAIRAPRAWAELTRRRGIGRLSAAHEARLTRLALDEQADTRRPSPAKPRSPIFQDLLDYLGDRALAGRLDESQKRQFFEATVTPVLRLRRLVRDGDEYPVEMGATGAGPKTGAWWVEFANESILVGGRAENIGGGGGTSGFNGGGGTTYRLKGRPAGEYPLAATRRLRAYHGPHGDLRNSRLVHEWTVTASDTLRVVDSEPPGTFKLIDKPELAATMQAALRVVRFGLRDTVGGRQAIEVSLHLGPAPENMAFEVSARVAGREYPLSTVYVARGGQTTWAIGTDKLRGVQIDKADFVFRASEKVARGTVDLFDIWNGEVVIKDVPFVRPTTQPATAPAKPRQR